MHCFDCQSINEIKERKILELLSNNRANNYVDWLTSGLHYFLYLKIWR